MLTPHHASSRRGGATLTELLVALSIFGLVATTCLSLLATSARAFERTTLTSDQRAQLAGAALVTSALLAGLSPSDGDVIAASDTAVRFWGTVASGISCRISGNDTWVPQGALATQVALGAASTMPQSGDILAAWDEGPTSSTSDDGWTRHRVLNVSTPTGGCVGGPIARSLADAAVDTWRLEVAPPIDTLRVGAPLHILRAQRLALYSSAGDWSLGHSETTPMGPWATIQPAAGPLTPPSAPTQGLEMQWLDTLGSSSLAAPHALQVRVRAPMRHLMRTATGLRSPVDSHYRFLALHNRQ